jgi:hypothetical protein
VGKPSYDISKRGCVAEAAAPPTVLADFDLKKLSAEFLVDPYPTYRAQ